jgi:hypothetical protein
MLFEMDLHYVPVLSNMDAVLWLDALHNSVTYMAASAVVIRDSVISLMKRSDVTEITPKHTTMNGVVGGVVSVNARKGGTKAFYLRLKKIALSLT